MKKRIVKIVPVLISFLFLAPAIAFADDTFIPLTNLPGLQEVAGSPSLPAFLNTLYKLCIGAAAVIAVLQIMRGGFEMMRNTGNVGLNQQAKDHIQNSILGLILVLSPYIVFSIINPKILDLSLDFSGLKPESRAFTGEDATLWSSRTDHATAAARCGLDGGIISYSCVKSDGTTSRNIGAAQTCNADERVLNICRPSGNTAPNSLLSCTTQYQNINANPPTRACNTANGYQGVPNGCCVGATVDAVCCAQPKGWTPPAVAAPAATAPSTATAQPAKPAAASSQPAAARYFWQAYFRSIAGNTVHPVQLGPYNSAQQCSAKRDEFVRNNASSQELTDRQPCLCDTPASTQASCPLR